MGAHSKGPWKVYRGSREAGEPIIGIGDWEGAGVTDPFFGLWGEGEEREANARLIAAAPDLLEALQLAEIKSQRGILNMSDFDLERVTDLRRAAIAKATGEPAQ